MIKIYIQNYFMENMFHRKKKKKKKTDNNKQMKLHQQHKNKRNQIVYNN